ncbi:MULTISPECIES: response regulator transcription factor [Pseudidiomarina]|uniref:response regulator transcription factor n=1 Tax=Pseudidiomarina TaxID=2800384 RepID=UPI00215A4847|nr:MULTISPECIES: response regulator transcription factor [Pseudidiomarina]
MSTGKPTLLVIEDEAKIRSFIRISLQAEGFQVYEAATLAVAKKLLPDLQCDAIILDLGLPDGDGQQFILELKAKLNLPILVLSARDDEEEKVRALTNGANDYLTKPFGIRELVARLHVLFRDLRIDSPSAKPPRLVFDTLEIEYAQHSVRYKGEALKLSPKEFELLWLLASNHQKLLLQRDILTEIWGPTHRQDVHYLRIFISQLRRKLDDDSREPKFIETLPGIGYRFLAAPKQA